MYFASTGLPLPTCEFKEFLKSWVYLDGHCYILSHSQQDSTFTISLNFPNSDKVISEHIMKLVKKKTFSDDTGSLLGYKFEAQFFNACSEAKSFTVLFDGKSETFQLNACLTIGKEGIPTLHTNILYKLFSSHPAIDFVGQFIANDTIYLLMIQISVSTYVQHTSKVWHLK